ncbi:hypothetical protein B0T26DRAFT_181286 [Lasiosphaeria miniovina]|uniref:Secreted protein n=1 Tax=Lasiosphaeria miniovina TaxID=1954250 RepID=A0AA40B6P4_9PEZI|nr:uncharacterized protein B0T26DRAFT_181286 [Lasiosphaeria miniovina]KAK0728668.1 hypothetical protein B0T26DRAFT_181286 [Lasiosphaeria miniovina]
MLWSMWRWLRSLIYTHIFVTSSAVRRDKCSVDLTKPTTKQHSYVKNSSLTPTRRHSNTSLYHVSVYSSPLLFLSLFSRICLCVDHIARLIIITSPSSHKLKSQNEPSFFIKSYINSIFLCIPCSSPITTSDLS